MHNSAKEITLWPTELEGAASLSSELPVHGKNQGSRDRDAIEGLVGALGGGWLKMQRLQRVDFILFCFKFEDPIGFIKQAMYWAACHLASREITLQWEVLSEVPTLSRLTS